MPTELPIACSLSATEQAVRLAQMAGLGRDALLDVKLSGTHATLRFAAGSSLRERVESFVAAESACCAFLAMQVTDEPDRVVLDTGGRRDPDPHEPDMTARLQGRSPRQTLENDLT